MPNVIGWIYSSNGPNDTYSQPPPYPMPSTYASMNPDSHLPYIQPANINAITAQPAPCGPLNVGYSMTQQIPLPSFEKSKSSANSSLSGDSDTDGCCKACCKGCGNCCLGCLACCADCCECMWSCLECLATMAELSESE